MSAIKVKDKVNPHKIKSNSKHRTQVQQNDPAANLLKYRNPHLETPSRVIVYPQTFYYNRIGQAVRPYAFADIKFGRPFLFESSKQFRETYNLGIPLGSGSTACVRRCENRERSNSKCAKMVNIDCARDVLNEINILKKLYHPQVVDIYEVLEEPKKYYIILEICIGGDIQQGLQSRPSYNEEEAAHIIQGVLIALSYCHRKGIVHRNIKPGNIMFKNSSSKMPKLIDFGSAADLTREKLPLSKIVGQLAYMAPEVLEENYTEKADIWATGVVMYELLSNKVPFDASTDQDVMMAIRDGSFAFDGPAWRSVSAEAKDLIRQMLLYNPKSRISAKDALRHPWILTQAPLQPDNKSINEHLGNMIDCKISNKLQEAILSMICHRINRDEYSSLEHTFLCLDTDYDGLINFEEFKAGFQKFYRDPFADVIQTSNSKVMALKNETQVPSFQDYCMQDDDDLQLSQIDNQRKQLDHALIFARCDLDDDGFLNWHDFLLTACNKRRSLSKYNLDEAFYSFDSYQKNFVTYDDLECAYGKFEDKGVNVWEDIIKEGLNQLRQRGTYNGTNVEGVDDGLISQDQGLIPNTTTILTFPRNLKLRRKLQTLTMILGMHSNFNSNFKCHRVIKISSLLNVLLRKVALFVLSLYGTKKNKILLEYQQFQYITIIPCSQDLQYKIQRVAHLARQPIKSWAKYQSLDMSSYQRTDSKYYDYSHFPKKFQTDKDAIDTYNELGYNWKLQFQFSLPRKDKDTFTLECPFSKCCPVRAKFTWNKEKQKFIRAPQIQIYHDHCVQLRSIDPETDQKKATQIIREKNKNIKASKLADILGIQPYEAMHLIKKTKLEQQCSQIDITQNCNLIGGLSNLSLENPEAMMQLNFQNQVAMILANDLQLVRDQKPLSTLIQNLHDDQYMAFVQTADMYEMFKRNYKSGLLVSYIPFLTNQNKYNMNMILITGVDMEIGNIITYGVGLASQKTSYAINWILVKFLTQVQALNKLVKIVVTDLDKIMIKACQRIFDKSKILVSHYSVLKALKQICISYKLEDDVYDKSFRYLSDVLSSESKTSQRECFENFKHFMSKQSSCYQQVDYTIIKYQKLWKPECFREDFTGGLHSYFRLKSIYRYFKDDEKDLLQIAQNAYNQDVLLPQAKSVKDILDQLNELEQINETVYFKFNEADMNHLMQSALYLSIKKAFTHFAVTYILKQMQIAEQNRDLVELKEKRALLLYRLKFPIYLNDQKILQKFTLTASNESQGLRQLECSCNFYKNYQMICWHMLILLNIQQIKHIAAFEHLKIWREIVGVKNRDKMGEKQKSSTYSVKKEKRLRSFIEFVSLKHKNRMKKEAEAQGVSLTMMSRKAGGHQSDGEQEEYDRLTRDAKTREKDLKEKQQELARLKKDHRKKADLKRAQQNAFNGKNGFSSTMRRKSASKERKRDKKSHKKDKKKDKKKKKTK
eukprot:403342210